MVERCRVTDVKFHPALPADVARGLQGFLEVTIEGELQLTGILLRRSREGRRYIAFSRRTDNRSEPRPYARFLGTAARREFERQVFSALGLHEEAST